MIQTHTEATNNRLCDPYQELALAIVRQAANDYRSLARRIEATGNEMDQRYLICIAFAQHTTNCFDHIILNLCSA